MRPSIHPQAVTSVPRVASGTTDTWLMGLLLSFTWCVTLGCLPYFEISRSAVGLPWASEPTELTLTWTLSFLPQGQHLFPQVSAVHSFALHWVAPEVV